MKDPLQDVLGPAGPAPLRPAHSVRRTSSIDMLWPEGFGRVLLLVGNARDAVTIDPAADPTVIAAAHAEVGIGQNRTIQSISAEPARPGIEELVGCRGGGHLRSALDHVLPGEREAGTPLHLVLDDISGSSLIAGFVGVRFPGLMPADARRGPMDMEGICIGFAPGSSALIELGEGHNGRRVQQVGSLVNPEDPAGWHELPELPEVAMRRARRIDVWRDGDTIVIDSAFQDSVGDPELKTVAVHEYRLEATADARTMELLTVTPEPRILPFIECPSAKHTASRLIGTPLSQLRTAVLDHLGARTGART